MRIRSLTLLFTLFFISTVAVLGQTSWLDRPVNNWNNAGGNVPAAPRSRVIEANCRSQVRPPASLTDNAMTRAGWSLFGATQIYGRTTLVNAMAGTDGMCRPTQFNTFVFVNDRFAGTLSPMMMDSRTDGALTNAILVDQNSVTAEFSRYTERDALCCPSRISTVTYSIDQGLRATVRAQEVRTRGTCEDGGEFTTQDNVVSGTVTYRQRISLPSTAILIVRLVDASRADATAEVIAERRIDIGSSQVPISFDMAYDRTRIVERNRYAIRAEIRDGNRLLFITPTNYPVITQGNPRVVEVVVAPVGGAGGGGVAERTVSGAVTYLQRIALPRNSDVTVKIVDAADPTGTPLAETTVQANGRQVPIPFEIRYSQRDVDRQRNYEVWAEIRTAGQLRFRSERGEPVNLRDNNRNDTVTLTLTAASDMPAIVTGRTLSLSKLGAGSMQIGDQGTMFLIRGTVNIRTDGSVTVVLSAFNRSTTFTGKLVHFDSSTLRIWAENSGDASASGEIEINYSGSRLNSVRGNNLSLDGQAVTINF